MSETKKQMQNLLLLIKVMDKGPATEQNNDQYFLLQ